MSFCEELNKHGQLLYYRGKKTYYTADCVLSKTYLLS